MYFLLKMGIFQPAMLVYQRVSKVYQIGVCRNFPCSNDLEPHCTPNELKLWIPRMTICVPWNLMCVFFRCVVCLPF